jgi:ABC-type nickel/cobalt efflux system permease component RcnA
MKRLLLVLLFVVLAVLGFGRPASAHPLGNFSVNELASLDLYPSRVDVAVTVDLAELPTLQEKPGAVPGYASASCKAFADAFAVTVDGSRLSWTVSTSSFALTPGAAGLSTSRFNCSFTSPLSAVPSTVDVTNGYRSDRIGWRELTAAGHGVHLVDSPIPSQSVSGGLTAYPQDLLSSPLNVRSAHLSVAPGDGPSSSAATKLPGASWFPVSRWVASADETLRGWVADPHVGPAVGVLAVLLALVLGAAHAALPGHGKTVMAAYLAGRHGRPRDALAVGATVTATHTGGVLVLGLLLTTVAGLAGEKILAWLGVASGALVAVLGAVMLMNLLRRRGAPAPHHHHHGHGHSHGHHHSHDHVEGHDHSHGEHDHDEHGHHHDGDESRRGSRPSRLSLVSMGIAGGLVPSPSALVVLLGAIGLGRTGFGVLLVIGYGVGMAATLTAAGLLLIRVQDRWSKRLPRLTARLSRIMPTGTAALVLLVGLGLAGRAFAGI